MKNKKLQEVSKAKQRIDPGSNGCDALL